MKILSISAFLVGATIGWFLGFTPAHAHDQYCDGLSLTGQTAMINGKKWVEVSELVHFGTDKVHIEARQWVKESELGEVCDKFK